MGSLDRLVTMEMERAVWIGEISGVRSKRTHEWLGHGVDSNKEGQSLPKVPERTEESVQSCNGVY